MGLAAIILSVVALALAGIWSLLMLFVLAIGSSTPPLATVLAVLWPSIGAAGCAVGALIVTLRSRPGLAFAVALAAVAFVPVGAWLAFGR